MALKDIRMPKLGESVTEGTITTWLVKEGDYVNKYDPIAEVMTDKVNAEVPSTFSGTIKEIVVKEGETVAVNELICYIETDDEAEGKVDESADNSEQPAKETETAANKQEKSGYKGVKERKNNRYSPAVIRLASEHGIDLETIEGTGLGGRVTRKDVLRAIEAGTQPKKEKTMPEKAKKELTAPPEKQAPAVVHKQDREIPVTGVRKIIAENMVRSKTEIPHAWMQVEVDVTDLVKLRNKVKDAFKEREGFTLTYFPFFIYAVAQALREFPELNSTWAKDKIIQRHEINLSIAVAKENELYVPVIKHADDKNIKGIAKELNRLVEKTYAGKLTQDDVSGGTFTVNNTGVFGSVSSMGIINYPQAAILQVEKIVKRPVIIDDMFAARDIVNLSLSIDHRILDGLIAGRFIQRVKDILENMNEDTVDI